MEEYSGHYDCLEFDVKVRIPSSTPFVNLSFIYSGIHISNSLDSNIGAIDVSTQAGSISSDTSRLTTNSTTIKTSAGSLKGKYTLGEFLSLTSQAGIIDIEVTMDTSIKSPEATFQTQTSAGSIHVNLLSPLKHRNQIISTHRCQAGSVNIIYPGEWEGVVEGSTAAGSLRMRGESLEIVEERGGFGNKYERAVKGDKWEEKSSVDVSSSAGSVVFELA